MGSTKKTDENIDEAEADEKVNKKDLEAELIKKTKLADEYLNGLKYLQADFENYKKRVAREKEDYVRQANESLILELIDVYENLERALDTSRKSGDDKFSRGLEMIYSEMRSVLEKHGLKPIKAVGEKFDPYLHEAMMQADSGDHEDETILEEFQRGYMLNSKVIRHSKVKVSKRC
ncbi:nucleotide exchange factor GrpE [Methanocella sp. CWC-04]|uniref:Protein GrpE n=1 Tax=Methanooceanicella nereidis TaxID=2052831 RepID=A0AAP2W554_9EURY|nr:nucleotide exchange factor GrpE [Methanocella sp. CWC-04]MCD1293968.1 nucleotide exchange factor GrpE [Methanocella sp. CWC-04]